MLLQLLTLTPFLAITSCFVLAGTILVICLRSSHTETPSGFGRAVDRRRVSYRGAVAALRTSDCQEAA